MKNKVKDDEVVTRKILKEELAEYPTKKNLEDILKNYPTTMKVELMIEQSEMRTDERARKYRDEILTKLDQIVGELAQMRDDREFDKYDKKKMQGQLDDHEKRIDKIERRSN